MPRVRADRRLVALGLCTGVEQAARAILAGTVHYATVDHRLVRTPGEQVAVDERLEVRSRRRFVSRGGEKLEGALRRFGYDATGVHALDMGASTGGFTDCLLHHGAAHVCAVDVGYGQLAWKLRTDQRVEVHDRFNVRIEDLAAIGAPFDTVVADLSFISLRSVLPAIAQAIGAHGTAIVLVKPQFEAAPGQIGEHGVVADEDAHIAILAGMLADFTAAGFAVSGVTFSPIRGPEGNIEFWIQAQQRTDACGAPSSEADLAALAAATCAEAHRALG